MGGKALDYININGANRMKIGIVDADLIWKRKQRFPNLACMKISSYYKARGHDVELLLSYDNIEDYDKIFISKVFTDTPIDESIFGLSSSLTSASVSTPIL